MLALILALHTAAAGGAEPEWTGHGGFRVLVRVEPVEIDDREFDEMPARCEVDFPALLAERNITGEVDLSTLQVHRYDPHTGKAEAFPPFDNAVSPFDRPCRFDDQSVPWEYPDRANYPSDHPDGRGPVTIRPGGGRLFNREMDNTQGFVNWVHTQVGDQPAHYAIYWDIEGREPFSGRQVASQRIETSTGRARAPIPLGSPLISPAPWIGDVDVYRREEGQPLGGLAHFTASVGDLNGDGLFDIVASAEKGDMMWFPNRGARGNPKFVGCRMLTDEDGPINVGWYGAPFVYDWDDDGLPDVLAGTSHNVILWWKNVGTQRDGSLPPGRESSGDGSNNLPTGQGLPSLVYQGFVQADGGRLEVPESPVPEAIGKTFSRDYYNQPWVGDWDGDGIPDILTGGYTTGLIFYYRGTGRDENGVPVLAYQGPLEADGRPIDTTWAAAPTAHDFNGDGRMELITGSWWASVIPRPRPPGEAEYLMYYTRCPPYEEGERGRGGEGESRGTEQQRASPSLPVSPSPTPPPDGALCRTPLPKVGSFPKGNIARPSVVDWNDDGLIDLLVSDNSGSLYRFLNVGTASEPRWEMNSDGLTATWGFVRDHGFTASADVNGDGRLEMLAGTTFRSYEGAPYTPHIVNRGVATVNGKRLTHELYPGPGYGDPYYYPTLHDWDGDGRVDLLWGTHQGNIFLHRGKAPVAQPPSAVPPPPSAVPQPGAAEPQLPQPKAAEPRAFDFEPGIKLRLSSGEDLRVGPPVMDSPEEATDFTILQGSRIIFCAADFDGDGIDDLAVTETYGNLWIFLNTRSGGTDTLSPGVQIGQVLGGGRSADLNIVDWNEDGKPDLIIGRTTAKPGAIYINESTSGNPKFAEPIQPLDLPFVFWGASPKPMDWNGDGDEDFIIHSEFYAFWAERSFLRHGYPPARKIAVGGDGFLEQRSKGGSHDLDR